MMHDKNVYDVIKMMKKTPGNIRGKIEIPVGDDSSVGAGVDACSTCSITVDSS